MAKDRSAARKKYAEKIDWEGQKKAAEQKKSQNSSGKKTAAYVSAKKQKQTPVKNKANAAAAKQQRTAPQTKLPAFDSGISGKTGTNRVTDASPLTEVQRAAERRKTGYRVSDTEDTLRRRGLYTPEKTGENTYRMKKSGTNLLSAARAGVEQSRKNRVDELETALKNTTDRRERAALRDELDRVKYPLSAADRASLSRGQQEEMRKLQSYWRQADRWGKTGKISGADAADIEAGMHDAAELLRMQAGGYSGGEAGRDYLLRALSDDDERYLTDEGKRIARIWMNTRDNAADPMEKMAWDGYLNQLRNDPRFYREEDRERRYRELKALFSEDGRGRMDDYRRAGYTDSQLRAMYREYQELDREYGQSLGQRAANTVKGSLLQVWSGFQEAAGALLAPDWGETYNPSSRYAREGDMERALAEQAGMREMTDRLMNRAEVTGVKASSALNEAKRGASAIGKLAVDVGSTGLQVAGDMAANMIAPGLGLALMGTRAFGNAHLEARMAGASQDEAMVYGVAVGAVELLTEKLFSASLPFSKAYGRGITKLDDLAPAAFAKVLRNETAGKLVWAFTSEGLEEVLADAVNPLLSGLTYDNDVDIFDERNISVAKRVDAVVESYRNEDYAQWLYDGLVGGILGGLGGVVDLARTGAAVRQRDVAGVIEETLIQAGENKPEGTEGYAAALAARAKTDRGETLSDEDLGELVRTNASAAEEKGVEVVPEDGAGELAQTATVGANWVETELAQDDVLSVQEYDPGAGRDVSGPQAPSVSYADSSLPEGAIDRNAQQTVGFPEGAKESAGESIAQTAARRAAVQERNDGVGRGDSGPLAPSAFGTSLPEGGSLASVGNDAAETLAERKRAMVASSAKTLGEKGESTMNRMYDGDIQDAAGYVRDMTRAYNAGVKGVEMPAMPENATANIAQVQAAYLAGRADTQKQEGMRNGRKDIYLRQGEERYDGADPGGQVRGVEEGAGEWRPEGRTADSGAAALHYGEKVSAASLGIANGGTGEDFRIVTGGSTRATRAAQEVAEARGYDITFIAGGDLTVGGVSGIRGYIDMANRRMVVRADDPDFTAEQIARHEAGHDMVSRGEVDVEAVRERLKRKHGEKWAEDVSAMYAAAFAGSEMTAEEIWEEILCDSLGNMNVFTGMGSLEGSWTPVLRSVKEETNAYRKEARGPPERGQKKNAREGVKFSIHYTVDNVSFVSVDEDILAGVPKKKWITTVKENLAAKFPDGVRVGNHLISINATSRREMTYSEYTKWLGRNQKSVYMDKFRATNYADEIILASRGYINEGLAHVRKDSIRDFARGTVLLRIGKNDYSADVIVGITTSGNMLLYDFVNLKSTTIKERSRSTKLGNQEETRRSGASASEKNVPQTGREVKREAEEFSDTHTKFSVRTKKPPEKTGKAYKVFFAKNGNLYPPMVANPGGEGTPVGIWLDADIGAAAPPSKTGRPQVQAGGKGTNAGKGSLAFRPGWHLGDVPKATQFARKNPETGVKDLFPADFVWAECEYAADVDYQDEAMSYGYTEKGRFRHSYAGLPKLPEDGYYRYRTNPNPDTVPWIITGAMRVTRILTDAETDAICRENGVEPMARQGGPLTAEKLEKMGIPVGDVTEKFSRRLTALDALRQGNERLEERVAYWKGQTKRTTEKSVLEGDVRRVARSLVKDYSSTVEPVGISDGLQELGNYIVNAGENLSWTGVKDRAVKVARQLIENAEELVNEDELERFRDVKRYLRERTIKFADNGDIPDLADFRKRYFNRLRISPNKGRTADVYWQELQMEFGYDMFPDDIITESDMIQHFAWLLDSMDAVYANPYSFDMAEAVEWCANDIIDRMMGEDVRQTAPTYADRQAAKLEAEKGKTGKAREEARQARAEGREAVREAERRGKETAKDAALAGMMAQGRKDASKLRESNEKLQAAKDELNRVREDAREEVKTTREEALLAGMMAQGRKDAENLRRAKAAIQAEKETRNRKLKELRDRQREKERKQSQNRKAAELRRKIEKHAKALSGKLLRPTDEKHIPEGLRKAVAGALDAVNLESKDGKPTKRTEAFLRLREAYATVQSESAAADTMVIDPDLLDNLDKVVSMRDTPIADMGVEQLETVWRVLKAVETSVASVNKAFGQERYETISGFADAIRGAVKHVRQGVTFGGKAGGIQNLVSLDMMTPEEYFRRMGDGGKAVWKMLRTAQDRHITLIDEFQTFGEKARGKLNVKKLEKERHTFTFDGDTFDLTTAQIMNLYALMNREQAREHVLLGGIRPTEIKRMFGTETFRAEPVHVTQEHVGEILSVLTAEQVDAAQKLQKYAAGRLSEMGNEASMLVYGYKKFREENYWPIQTDRNQVQSDVAKEAQAATIAGRGFTKQTTPHANNAVRIGSIFDVFAEHANGMATYAAWLAPMENMKRVFNFSFWEDNGEQLERTGDVKSILQRVFGKKGDGYWYTLMADLNNGVKTVNDNTFATMFTGAYKSSAIGGNIRVWVQQPTSIIRAMDMVNPADFLAGAVKARPGKWALIKKYAPIAVWKDWGYFEADTGRQMKDIMFGSDTVIQKFNNGLMAPAGFMDSLGWSHIWNALEIETARKHRGMDTKSEAFYRLVAERFNEVIDHSQVVDGILQRSQIMRSSEGVTKMATSFMAEPTKIYNMMAGAIWDVRKSTGRERGKAMKRIALSAFALCLSIAANAAAQSLVDALRDDDREQKYWEKFWKAFHGQTGDEENRRQKVKSFFTGNLGSGFDPVSYVPFLKDIVSIVNGYDVGRMDMEALSKMVKAAQNAVKALSGDSALTKKNAFLTLFAETARLTGTPVANLKRDVLAVVNTYSIQTDNYVMQYEMTKLLYDVRNTNNGSKFTGILAYAYSVGDLETARILRERMKKDGIPDEKIQKVVKAAAVDAYGTDAFEAMQKEANDAGIEDKKLLSAVNSRKKEAEGVETVDELSERAVLPQHQKAYDSTRNAVTGNALWSGATEEQKEKYEKRIYELTTGGGDEKTVEKLEGGKEIGVDTAEYILYQLAKEMANEDGNTSITQDEATEAVKLLAGSMELSDEEMDWLWHSTNKGWKATSPFG